MRGHRLVSDQDLPIRMRCIPDQLGIWSILSGNALVLFKEWPYDGENARMMVGHQRSGAAGPFRASSGSGAQSGRSRNGRLWNDHTCVSLRERTSAHFVRLRTPDLGLTFVLD